MAHAVPQTEHPDRTAAQITIVRNSPDDTQTRQIKIFLDGEIQGELMFGNEISLDTAPCPHVIGVDNTWNRKEIQIEIPSGKHLRFLAKSSAGKFAWFLLGFLGAGPMQVSIEPAPGFPPS
jgi:hypothetical protein